MIIGSAHSLVQPRISSLQRALSCFPETEGFARLDNSFGSGGLYYADGMIKTFSDVIANPTAGEPISVGMLVDGTDAPTVVQAYGPNVVPNSTFDVNTDGWTDHYSSLAAVGGEMVISKNAGVNYGYGNANVEVEVGKSYRIRATQRCGTCDQVRLAMSDAISKNSGADNTTSTSPVSIEYEGVATSTNLGLQFVVITSGTEAATAIVDDVIVEEIYPHAGYSNEDRLGSEIATDGTFENASDLDNWVANNGTHSIESGTLRGENVGGTYHASARDYSVEVGATYEIRGQRIDKSSGAASSDFHVGTASNSNAYLANQLWEDGPVQVVATDTTLRLSALVGGNTSGAWKQHDDISIRRVYRDHTVKVAWDANGATGNAYGAEMVRNGGADTDTDWTKGTNWTHGAGVYSFSGVGTDTLRQDIGLLSGLTYRVRYTVSGRTTGSVTAVLGGDSSGTAQTTNDTFTENIVSGTNGLIYLQPNDDFDGSIDDVSVQLVGRVIWSAWKDADNFLILYFLNGLLKFEAVKDGASVGYVAVPSVDDGGAHRAALYWEEVTGTISLDVDGQGLEGPEIVTNGGFDIDATGWSAVQATIAAVAGELVVTSTIASWAQALETYTLDVGVMYEVSGYARAGTDVSPASVNFWDGVTQHTVASDSAGAGTSDSGLYEVFSTSCIIKLNQFGTVVGREGYFDNISLKAKYTRSGLTLPTNLNQFALGHLDGANQLNGLVLEHAAANGDQITAWQDIPI